jgi:hypothetical protein
MSQEHHPKSPWNEQSARFKTTSDIEARRTELQGVQKRMVRSASLLDLHILRAPLGSRSRTCWKFGKRFVQLVGSWTWCLSFLVSTCWIQVVRLSCSGISQHRIHHSCVCLSTSDHRMGRSDVIGIRMWEDETFTCPNGIFGNWMRWR